MQNWNNIFYIAHGVHLSMFLSSTWPHFAFSVSYVFHEFIEKPFSIVILIFGNAHQKIRVRIQGVANKFYKGRPAVMEFRALVNQYYKNSGKRLHNFTGIWEYMMGCFVLINRMMSTENSQDFVEKIKKYNESSYYLFYFVRWFEEKLIG